MAEVAVSFRATFEADGLAASARYKMQQVLMEWLRDATRNSNTNKLHRELEAAAGFSVPEFYLFVIDDLNTARDDHRYEQALEAMKS
jgi:hypothetical protein